eukprot:3848333-Rhodomonas_salina.3
MSLLPLEIKRVLGCDDGGKTKARGPTALERVGSGCRESARPDAADAGALRDGRGSGKLQEEVVTPQGKQQRRDQYSVQWLKQRHTVVSCCFISSSGLEEFRCAL